MGILKVAFATFEQGGAGSTETKVQRFAVYKELLI
jgi:hypothetical protein